MLVGLAQYVLVGHSERRAVGESDEQIARKVAAAAEAGLTPLLFVGEDEPGVGARSQTEHRLRQGISHIDLGQQAVLVVYEPAWAIGADRAADAQYVREMVADLKDLLRRLGASDPEVLYGGTVNKENIEQFTKLDVLDGVGATRASLDAHGFLAMIDRMAGSS
jgi:triosephosphate isomerase